MSDPIERLKAMDIAEPWMYDEKIVSDMKKKAGPVEEKVLSPNASPELVNLVLQTLRNRKYK